MTRALIEALESYQRWLERRRRAKGQQTEQHTRAIRSVLRAVSATRAHLHDLRRGARPDRSREARISQLWVDAAVDVRTVDRRLSRIAVIASQQWADPEFLANPDFGEVPEQLDLIQRQCEWLLDRS